MQLGTDELRAAVESKHGCKATLFYVANVIDPPQATWSGHVHVFDLEGNPEAARAYAWSAVGKDGSTTVYTALHVGNIACAADAVRMAMRRPNLRRSASGPGP